MSGNVTLYDLKTQTRDRANMANSQFVDDTELTRYINQSAAELYDILTSKSGSTYNAKTMDFTIGPNILNYPLPTDFYKLLGIDYLVVSGQAITVKPFQFGERNMYRYPTTGFNLRMHYVPIYTKLSKNTDLLKGFNGYENLIIVSAAIRCLQKEESDTQQLMIERAEMMKRITDASENRDQGFPRRINDIDRSRDRFYYQDKKLVYRLSDENVQIMQRGEWWP
jgi:hypothetical protein